jgi:hypothetical protein
MRPTDSKVSTPPVPKNVEEAKKMTRAQRIMQELRAEQELTKDFEDKFDKQFTKDFYENLSAHDKSIRSALKRAVDTVQTDLQLAGQQQAMRHIRDTPGVIGYRRVIHPELSTKTGVCGMCITAATVFYINFDLAPIHNGCNCDVLPITKTHDPGKTLNEKDNQFVLDLYKNAGGNDYQSLIKTNYRLDEHGELGLVMTTSKAKNDSAQYAARLAPSDSGYELRLLQAALDRLNERRANGEADLEGYIKDLTTRISALRK